jgi:glyoxylase-like metal-dependent hydrolase (beta-lactamase superfamily II)
MLEDDVTDIIKKARTGLGMKIEQVAQASGLALDVLRKLEAGQRAPSRPEVLAIASVLGLDGSKLASVACDGWAPQAVHHEDSVITVTGDIGGYAVKGYLLHDAATRDAVMVDTGYHPAVMLDLLEKRKLRLAAVCLTHGHVDHAGGLDAILSRHPVPVYIGEADWNLLHWKPSASLRKFANDGDTVQVGTKTLSFLATPGHTPGGMCYRAGDFVFVGDTLFAGSIGRANPASLYPVHLQSVRERLLTLPDSAALFPGHGPATTVAEEKAHNPFG